MNEPTLAERLRQDLAIVERRREDATQLSNALNISATLADEVDRLAAENAELNEKITSLQKELLGGVAEPKPVIEDPNPSGEPYTSSDHQ